jgi:hypothetical protein
MLGHIVSVVVIALMSLTCARHESSDVPPSEVAAITRQQIEHVTPRRDFVGPAPARLEWTALDGVDTYNITVITEIDTVLFEHAGARSTSIEWPKEITLEPGTYFWRVVGVRGGRVVADSGRAAFVVRE